MGWQKQNKTMYWEVMNMTIFPGQYVHLRLGAWNTEQDYLDEVQPVLTESLNYCQEVTQGVVGWGQ
jgi:hypothetical protein